MKNSLTVWLPAGQYLSQPQREALAIPATTKPSRLLYAEILARNLQDQINGDPKEAKWAMEMLLDQVASQNDQKHWGTAIVNSDNLMPILHQIDWSLPGIVRQMQNQDLCQRLEHLV